MEEHKINPKGVLWCGDGVGKEWQEMCVSIHQVWKLAKRPEDIDDEPIFLLEIVSSGGPVLEFSPISSNSAR